MSEGNSLYSDFAYDDAFRTIETYCDDVVINYINYFFNENYTGNAKIIRLQNENYVLHKDHSEEKDITDSHIDICENGVTKRYHIECESGKYSGAMLVKMFRYDSQIAINASNYENAKLYVNFSYSGILMLRNKGHIPGKADVIISTPGGEVSYDIPIMKVSDYTLEDIFEKKLYFLIPFYCFNIESELEKIDKDPALLEELADTYREILLRLDSEVIAERLSAVSNDVIIMLMHRVLYKLSMKAENVQKRVGDIMGGKVLELDYIKGVAKGRSEGLVEGRAEGKAEGRVDTLFELVEDGIIVPEAAAKRLNMSEDDFKKAMDSWLNKMSAV